MIPLHSKKWNKRYMWLKIDPCLLRITSANKWTLSYIAFDLIFVNLKYKKRPWSIRSSDTSSSTNGFWRSSGRLQNISLSFLPVGTYTISIKLANGVDKREKPADESLSEKY